MRILYVEDNDLIRNTIRETLELEGWKVEACADGWASLKKISWSVGRLFGQPNEFSDKRNFS
jgi:DNA-binding response OmpR family regulator